MECRRLLKANAGMAAQFLKHQASGPHYEDSERHRDEFVGRVPRSPRGMRAALSDLGFRPVSRARQSWRLPYDDGMQLHTIFYDGAALDRIGESGYSYLYSHYEHQWEENPWAYWQGQNYSGPEGVRRMKKLLDEYGVRHEPIRP